MSSASSSGAELGPLDPTALGSTVPGGPSDERPIHGPPPARVGPYEVTGLLGRGGMGVVLRARDPALARDVAVKVLDPGVASVEVQRRLEIEARAAARLDHPNIVRVLAAGEDQGRPWIAMELVPGPTLRAKLRDQGPLPPREAAGLAEALARALGHAHARGVVHRDVKPSNVLLAPDGAPRLADFGLARGLDLGPGEERPTETGQVLGTPSYLAPEQAAGRTDVGPAADVWGLGATLYELLAGRPPFLGATVLATLAATLEQEPTPPRDLRPDVDARLEAIVLRCLEKAPAARYPSCDALAADLRRWLDGGRVEARRPGPGARLAAAVRRRPARALAAALALALLAAGGGALATAPARAEARALERLGALRAAVRLGEAVDLARALPAAARGAPRTEAVLVAEALVWEAAGQEALARAALLTAAEAPAARAALLELHRLELAAEPGRGARITPALERLLARAAASPDDALGAFARAEAARARGEAAEAERLLGQALERAPRLVWARVERARLRDARGDPAGASEDLDRALAVDADLAPALVVRGNLRLAQADVPGARADLDRAVEVAPRLAAARYARARAWLAAGGGAAPDAARARDELDRALELDAGFAEARQLRAALRLRAGDAGGAREDLDRAVGAGLEAARVERARLGRDAARTLVDPAAREGALGEVLADLGAAVAALGSAAGARPDDALPEALALRAEVRGELGLVEEALADLGRALELEPGRAAWWVERATLALALGDARAAASHAGRALSLAPDLARAWTLRGQARLELGLAADARSDLDSAVRLAPGDPAPLRARAALRRAAGDAPGAREDLRAALALLPPGDQARAELERELRDGAPSSAPPGR